MQLVVHPYSVRGPVRGLEAHAYRRVHGQLKFTFKLTADLSQLAIPPLGIPARMDRLWERTCFEVFLSPSGSKTYCELNFSPAGGWAAYGFTDYRAGMVPLVLPRPPEAHWSRAPGHLDLTVTASLDDLLPGAEQGLVRAGIAAVLEEAGGRRSYWALTHGEGDPDFHRRDSFVLKLAGPRPRSP